MARPQARQTAPLPPATLDRAEAVPALIERPRDFLIVAGLAGAAQELTALTEDAPNVFGLGGAMGAAPMMGLGLALARPDKRVLVVTGDGELLMNLGALASIAVMAPGNFALICVDNAHYGETGNQDSHTGLGVRLDQIASGAGFPIVATINTAADLPAGRRLLAEAGAPRFILLRVKDGPPPRIKREMQPAIVRTRFRAHTLDV